MKTMQTTMAVRLAVAAAVAAGVLGCAAPAPDRAADLLSRIQRADAPDDHRAIARHFADEAARARQGAASHREMARIYGAMRSTEQGDADMAAHCSSLADLYESIAVDFDHLARGHSSHAH